MHRWYYFHRWRSNVSITLRNFALTPSLHKVFTLHRHIFSLLLLHLHFCNFALWHLCPNSESEGGPNGTPYCIVGLGSDCFCKAVERTGVSFLPSSFPCMLWSFIYEVLPQTELEWMCMHDVCRSSRSFVDTLSQIMSTALREIPNWSNLK